MPDGTYGQYEITRQGAQPAELYKFYWGGGSVSGTSAGDPDTTNPEATTVTGSTLPSCEGVDAPTFTVTETWTGGNDTDISGRALSGGIGTWTTMSLSTSRIDIVSGVAVMPAVDNIFPEYHVTGHGLGNDQSVSATAKFTSNPGIGEAVSFGVLARVDTGGADKAHALFCDRRKDGLGAITQEIYIQLWNDPTYGPGSNVHTITGFTLNVEHTIRLDVVGNKLYGYLDDELVCYWVDQDGVRTSGNPGVFEYRVDPLLSSVAITRWEAGTPNVPGDEAEVVGYARDLWNGADDTEINGRDLDGGDQTCLAGAEWVKALARPQVHGDIVDETLHVTERTDGNPLNWSHYVATGITDLGNDYRIESTVTLTAQPPGTVAPDSAWGSLIARHSSTTESGYEFIAQFVASAAHGGSGLGGMVFSIDRIVAESYTTLSDTIDQYLTGEVALGEHRLAMHVEGSRICGYFDGVLVVMVVDPLNLYPTGYPGICLCGSEVVATSWTVYSADTENQPCGTPTSGGGETGTPLITLNYTSADVEIVYEGETYVPFIAHRTNFRSGSGERTASEIELSVPLDHPVATLAMARGPIGCIVYRLDRQDTTDGAAAVPLQGQITKHRIEDRWCILTLGNVGTLLTRKLPRMLTQRACPHVFGGPFCQRDLTDLTFPGLAVTSTVERLVVVEGASVIAAGNGNPEFFAEGVLLTAGGDREFIETQSGDTLTLKQTVPDLQEGDTVTLQAGCKHTTAACDLLANIEHFGGEPGMPDRNPFTGTGLAGT